MPPPPQGSDWGWGPFSRQVVAVFSMTKLSIIISQGLVISVFEFVVPSRERLYQTEASIGRAELLQQVGQLAARRDCLWHKA